jgi:calcineurin-like phosphoesterase family protein
MNETLIQNCNEVVKKDDELYILGDFSFGNVDMIIDIARRLNGYKFLILGNHDRYARRKVVKQEFIWVKKYFQLQYKDRLMTLSHYPTDIYSPRYIGEHVIYLHGHNHHKSRNINFAPKSFNVGVDLNGMYPVSAEAIIKEVDRKS